MLLSSQHHHHPSPPSMALHFNTTLPRLALLSPSHTRPHRLLLIPTKPHPLNLEKPFLPSFSCNAASSQDPPDADTDEHAEKRFAIRGPTLPKIRDIDAARLALESAFQALSFEVSKLPIESALQGLSFDILKFLRPKQVFIFDITALVPSKLRRQSKNKTEGRDDVSVKLREIQYPRCAWPRTSKAVRLEQSMEKRALIYEEQIVKTEMLKRGFGILSESPIPVVYPHCKWPRESIPASKFPKTVAVSKRSEQSSLQERSPDADASFATHSPSTNGSISSKISLSRAAAVRPQSGSPRANPSRATGNGFVKVEDSKIDMSPDNICTGNKMSGSEHNAQQREGARCAWPRVTIAARGSDSTLRIRSDEMKSESKRTQQHEGRRDSPSSSWPRRMLSTSVGLSLMNQFFLVEGGSALASPIYLLGVLDSET